jgi:L-lysine exporter family protein LysE/ArgO
MASPLLIGFTTCLTLVVAIGAQNAFVLRQGIRQEHVGTVVALCTVSDVVLIAAGVAGFGVLVTAHPTAVTVARLGGAAFLVGYGILAAMRAARPSGLIPSHQAPERAAGVVLTCLALTFLNPHVYLDTVVLLGALANEHHNGRWLFAIGAITASAAWFSALGFGATRLRGLFATRSAWRILDGLVATTMLALAATVLK